MMSLGDEVAHVFVQSSLASATGKVMPDCNAKLAVVAVVYQAGSHFAL
jgi:hypothetical protein